MSGRFRQPAMNVRGILNKLKFHRHDTLYEKKGTSVNKNLMVNPYKSVSQRGDFSTPFSPVLATFYIDQYTVGILYQNCTVEYSHQPYNVESDCRTILATVTASNNSPDSFFYSVNRIEQPDPLIGRFLTYAAYVKSNTQATIEMAGYESAPHTGSNEFELLTVTAKMPETLTTIDLRVNMSPGHTGTNVGDYIEIGKEKLEIGSTFTGFDYVNPTINLESCRRTMLPITSASLYDMVGDFVAVAPSFMQCNLTVTPMTYPGFVQLIGGGANLTWIGNGSGTLTQGTLNIVAGLSDLELGKLMLSVSGSGFTVGQIVTLAKSNDSQLIYVDTGG